MTRVPLARPIGPVSSVVVGIPAEAAWDAPPPGVDGALWNLSRSTGLTIEQVRKLNQGDLPAIAAAAWNSGQHALRRPK